MQVKVFIVKTNLSHRLENYLPIASGIAEQTLDTDLHNTFQSGVLLVNTVEETLFMVLFMKFKNTLNYQLISQLKI